jgi:DNA-binding transcriptional ArsR family regulator
VRYGAVVLASATGDADVAAAAALIGEPARAALLQALMGERALAGSELAARAGIAPSTASEHLAKLVDGGLVVGDRRGRRRYFRLADPAVAAAIEALAVVAPPKRVRSLREASAGEALRLARTCYDHLAGRLGVELAAALERDGVVMYRGGEYRLGRRGPERLAELGVDVGELAHGRRVLVRPCLDWSERRRHVAGALGAALAELFFELGWVKRRESNRSVEVTASGQAALRSELDIDLASSPRP